MPLEIACFTPLSARIASQNGASRIELCKDSYLGGTTPLLSDFQTLKSQVTIPIYVMIRIRGGGFIYSSGEMVEMLGCVKEFDDAGADGFVFGILDERNQVDQKRCKELLRLVRGKPCTFHRAFDEIPVELMEQELGVLVALGIKAVLTSGGAPNAVEGKEALKRLVQTAGAKIDILVGGGVRSGNVDELKKGTGASWFHSSAVVNSGNIASAEEVVALKEALRR